MSERPGSWGGDERSLDQSIRSAAFSFLTEQTRLHGDVLPRELLAAGFRYGDERVPLLGPQGIFKPRLLEMPLSITTVPVIEGRERPYEDSLGSDNLVTYRYRGTDPSHRDNAGLRLAMSPEGAAGLLPRCGARPVLRELARLRGPGRSGGSRVHRGRGQPRVARLADHRRRLSGAWTPGVSTSPS